MGDGETGRLGDWEDIHIVNFLFPEAQSLIKLLTQSHWIVNGDFFLVDRDYLISFIP